MGHVPARLSIYPCGILRHHVERKETFPGRLDGHDRRLLALTATLHGQSNDPASTDHQLGLRHGRDTHVVLTGARVHVRPGEVVDDATLVIENGRGGLGGRRRRRPGRCERDTPRRADRLPGFVDPYSAYGLPAATEPERGRGRAPQYEGERTGLDSWNDAVHAEVRWIDAFTPDSKLPTVC